MNKFLIVVDIQNDFVEGALGTKEAISIVDNAVAKISAFNGNIIVTMDTHNEDYLNTQEGKKLPVSHCIKNTEGWKLNSKILSVLKDKEYTVIEKPTFGSFELINTVKALCKAGEELSIELIGLCTDICVVSNALLLKVAFTEAEISVDSACCAGVTQQKHEAALETMRSCQINII